MNVMQGRGVVYIGSLIPSLIVIKEIIKKVVYIMPLNIESIGRK